MSSTTGRAVDRTLTEREAEAASFLTSALPDGGDALRSQLKAARVLSESSCCASVHVLGDTKKGPPAPVTEVVALEALWTTSPCRLVRLVIAGDGWISHLELVHEEERKGPREFPSPLELDQPELRTF